MKDKIISFIWQHVLLLTFFLAYIQTTEAKGQSPCPSYGASIMNGDLYCGHQENSAFAMHSVMKFPQALYVADYLHKKGLTLSDFTFTFHFHTLEKEMATHSSVLAWRIPRTGEPGGLPSLGSHRVWHN